MNFANNANDNQPDEFIHDLSFDFFGNRIATCSSDHQIRIYSKDKKDAWAKTASFPAHDATIWKVKWAHPVYGSIIATCSADKSVMIWEEKIPQSGNKDTTAFLKNDEDSTWHWRIKLQESKESVEDIKFAPKHVGLTIAAASADGSVRIYEATDLMRLNTWKTSDRIEVNTIGVNCLSWNKSPFDPPMIVVGSKDAENSCMNKSAMKVQLLHTSAPVMENVNASSSSDVKYLSIYFYKDHWTLLSHLSYETPSGEKIEHKSAVNDVSWNQLNGRSYHLITSCGKDGVFVWYVKFTKEDHQSPLKILDAKKVYSGGVNVWKTTFNTMGTLLTFSGEDNKVRICKSGYDRNWNIVEEFEEESFGLEAEDNNLDKEDSPFVRTRSQYMAH